MKVLIIHQHFKLPTHGGAIRSYYLAKGLVDGGHQAVVVTATNDEMYSMQQTDGIEVHYLPVAYKNAFGFYARTLAFIRFVFAAARIATQIDGVTHCYAISVPLTTSLVARWVKRKKKIPYLFEVGDLWPDAPIQMEFLRNPLLRWIARRMELAAYRESLAVVALSAPIADAVRKRSPGTTVHVIPNMADCEFYQPSSKPVELEEKYGVKGQFVIAYIGAMGLANGLDHLIECANKSRKSNLPVHFMMCGEGALLERLKENAHHLGLKNITFTGLLNRDGVRDMLSISDAVFVSYKRLPILETGSPNKYFDGLAAGKLILINFGGWIREEIERTRCGIRTPSDNPDHFVTRIQEFIYNAKTLGDYQNAARQLAVEKYDRKKLIAQWVACIK